MNPSLTYYACHGPISDPGAHSALFDALPDDVADLARVVQGITIHVFWAERYGYKFPPQRAVELQLRTIEKRLAQTIELDPRPLLEPRALDKKLLGNCRDHSVLLAAMLRQRGCPARARCGFATYFLPDHYEDHWVTEYWNRGQNRWVLVDAQLDNFQAETLGIDFDPLDVPRNRLLVAGQAWQMCRSGAADPEKFGIFDMHGLDFVRGNLVRDLAALNKVELLPWDCWGIILDEQIDSPDGLSLLDRVASLTTGAELDLDAVRSTYADPRLRMDGKLLSYVDGGMEQIVVPVS